MRDLRVCGSGVVDNHPQILIDCVYLKVGVTSESGFRVQRGREMACLLHRATLSNRRYLAIKRGPRDIFAE